MKSPPVLLSTSLCNTHSNTLAHTPPGSCGEQQKCKRAKDELKQEQTGFPSLMVTVTSQVAAFQYFSAEGYSML